MLLSLSPRLISRSAILGFGTLRLGKYAEIQEPLFGFAVVAKQLSNFLLQCEGCAHGR